MPPALAVVERLDVIEGVGNGFYPAFVADAMHPLIIEAVEEALGRRVIPTVLLAAHRAGHPECFQPCPKGVAGVPASPVGVIEQSGCWLPAEPCYGQGIDDDIGSHLLPERPTDDFPVAWMARISISICVSVNRLRFGVPPRFRA